MDLWSAVVGAGGVFLGAALTGAFTLLKGRQEHRGQRQQAQREARRAAYAAFLASYHEVDRKISAASKLRPSAVAGGPPQPAMAEAAVSAEEFKEAVASVALEGPRIVASAAFELQNAVWDTVAELAGLCVDHVGSERPLFELRDPGTERHRSLAHPTFVTAANITLSGHYPDLL
ncbi:hypothetical protein [Streptomyces rimosus]|uniref:hypothetical protein n=1 Tax=Streptomyces rimosus TaxID=1927 RepID=UPI0037D2205C